MHQKYTFCTALLAALWLSIAHGADNATFAGAVKPFLEKHCTECHGADVQKAKLRLDNLAADFKTKDIADVWIKALDKVASGQMPPATEERPPQKILADATAFWRTQLHDTSLAKQKADGRVLLRRLNKTEYENTLSDLFEMDVAGVKELLPDDNTVAGFDNVSEGLDLSSAHLLRYQDAAERVLAQAVPLRLKKTNKERSTAVQQLEKNSGLKKSVGQQCKMDGEALVAYTFLPRYQSLSTPGAPSTGRYKVRVSAHAVNTGGKTLPIVFHYFAENVRDEGEVRACIDLTEKPGTVEFETDLKFHDKLVLNGWKLTGDREFKAKHKEGIEKVEVTEPGIAIEWAELEGPLDTTTPVSYKRIFGDVPLKPRSVADAEKKKQKAPVVTADRNEYQWMSDPLIPVPADPKKDAERLIADFVPRAARRPVAPETIAYFVKFAHDRLDKNYSFKDAMFAAYKAVLCSTEFLFLAEKPGKLDDYALASRLSYFLWRSMPDAGLLDLAAKGTLAKPETLHAQVERMLNDAKADGFIEDFPGQWLEMRKINATSPDPQMYGEFDQYLLWSMPRETRLFFAEILKNDLCVTQFIQSDWTFLNDRLAQHYGIKNIQSGSGLVKCSLPPELHRGGVLTQGSVLKVTADGTRTSPILRGKWVLEHILGKPPTPPPADVPSIEPDIRGATTIRQQLEKHRSTKACASCHKTIDPPGFALETYDVIGGWREFYRLPKSNGKKAVPVENYPNRTCFRGLDVEKGDTTPDGRAFKDIDEYKQILLDDKDQIARNVIQKLMVFSTGADLQFADREVVEDILADVKKKNLGLRSMIHDVVTSRVFLNK
jgi:hypothetical protein